MTSIFKWALLAIVSWGAWNSWRLREVEQPPGMMAAQEPRQEALEVPKPIEHHGYKLEALARYEITGRLLSRERYRWDASAELSPMDFALGWGPMSDSQILDRIDISQSARFASWRFEGGQPPIPIEIINQTMSNTHLIPANGDVFSQLNTMRVGQVVTLKGYLIRAKGPQGFTWQSSLVRTDWGAGACEVMYVESAQAKS